MRNRQTLAPFVAAALGGLAGCSIQTQFLCEASEECDIGADGVCEADGRCSYVDSTCESGRRYGGAGDDGGDCLSDGGGDHEGPEPGGPEAPEGLIANVVSPTQIDLTWTAPEGAAVTGYKIERCGGSASCTDFAQIGTAEGSPYSSTGLTAGTAYRFRLLAHDAAGNESVYSAIADATTETVPEVLSFQGQGNQNIPDANQAGITQTIDVSDARTVRSLNFKILVEHPWRGDIRVTLSHGGKSVILQDHEGPGEDDSIDDVVLDVDRDDWNDMPVAGAWSLNVMDFDDEDVGRLTSWSISPTVQ